MKRLLLIVVLGTVAFLAVAMAQEWEVFAGGLAALRGDRASTPAVALASGDRAAVEQAVRELLAVERHVYGSGGDPRFLDRLPAGDGVRAELAADTAYLRRNGRVQEPTLVDLAILDVEPVAAAVVTVRTREYWVVRFRALADGRETDPTVGSVVHARYIVARGERGWRVEGWEPDEPAPGDASNAAAPSAEALP